MASEQQKSHLRPLLMVKSKPPPKKTVFGKNTSCAYFPIFGDSSPLYGTVECPFFVFTPEWCCGGIRSTSTNGSRKVKSKPLPYLQYMCDVMCVWCAVCAVCPVCVFFLCRKMSKKTPFSLTFSETKRMHRLFSIFRRFTLVP
jgi:hypothetical protein